MSFKVNERLQRLCLWINQNFLLTEDLEANIEMENFKLNLTSIRDESQITIEFGENGQIRILTKNIELAGNLIQSLANFLNMDNLQTVVHCPKIEQDIADLFRKIDGLQQSFINLSLDLSQKKNLEKNLIVRIEDARLYNP